MSISSTYMRQKSVQSLKIVSIRLWNICGAFFNPIGMTFQIYWPCGVLKAVKGLADSFNLIHELCIAQEKIAEIHSVIYEKIHPRINQCLAGLDEALASQQMDMGENTHQQYLIACKRAHKLEDSIKPLSSPFLLQEEEKDNKSSTANILEQGQPANEHWYVEQELASPARYSLSGLSNG